MGLIAADTRVASPDTEALYRAHGAAVAALCRSLLRDPAETEDATQQVFLSAHRALLNGAVPREPLAWLLAVARNECYSRFRQRAVAPIPTGEAPDDATADASVHALRAGDLAGVWDEVSQMPAAQREAFLLREVRGLSYGQVAEELSLSPPSVRSLLLRARVRLRRRLRDVAALGGTPWLQSLLRLAVGGEGASPVPAATKAAAVGLGALALMSGGTAQRHAHRAPAASAHEAVRPHLVTAPQHVFAPVASAVAPRETSPGLEDHTSTPERVTRHDGGGPDRPTGSEDRGTSSSATEGSRDDGSDGTSATDPVTPQTTDGHDGSLGSDGGSDPTTTTADTTTTAGSTTTESSDGSDSPDGGSDGGSSSDG